MTHKIITVIALLAFTNFIIGCSSTDIKSVKGTDAEEMPGSVTTSFSPGERIVSLTLLNGEEVVFNEAGALFYDTYRDTVNVIAGTGSDESIRIIGIDDVLEARIETKHVNVLGTILTTVGIIAATGLVILLIVAATKKSCPFVYSYDGNEWKFDAEPYGGAISRGLQKTDYSRLEYLKAVNGTYNLMNRNEADESQFTDEMKVMVVDHPAGTTVAPDYQGNLFAYEGTLPPLEVRDEDGRDLRNFLKARDEIKWQSNLRSGVSTQPHGRRHALIFTFTKSDTATRVKLLVNAGTALWGSKMIEEMLSLRGDKVDNWYEDIDRHGPELGKLYYFMDREELYTLKINLFIDSVWVPRTFINGGGPLIDEDRIVELDVSNIPGNTFQIRVNPPRGFWKIDYIGCLENSSPVAEINEIAALRGEDQDGRDITGTLADVDERYYSMPRVGDWSKLEFTAPADPLPGLVRSLYLKTTGYYTLHLPKGGAEQTDLMNQLGVNPGMIVDYSMTRYHLWKEMMNVK